jgi:glyoxylase-like metal-dependent hydrolase (beta-lactamase superfamily II)
MTRSTIHKIAVPTPFLIGDVNTYLLSGDPLTLVDTGPNIATSLAALEAGLATAGVTVEDLELIVLTHQHTDHIGLTSVLQERSGASLAAFAPLVAWMASFPQSIAADDDYARALMELHGVPEELNAALAVTAYVTRAFGSSGAVDVALEDGAVLDAGGRALSVLHRPGHSPSDLLLWDQAAGIVLGGDHLMSTVASNAIMARPLGGDAFAELLASGRRPHPLLDYRASLRKTYELPDGVEILPGHGPKLCAHRDLISERLRVHERRARKIVRTLTAEPLTAHQIALAMWGRVAITQAPLMMSEVLGYLDMLLEDGAVHEDSSGPQTLFSVV